MSPKHCPAALLTQSQQFTPLTVNHNVLRFDKNCVNTDNKTAYSTCTVCASAGYTQYFGLTSGYL